MEDVERLWSEGYDPKKYIVRLPALNFALSQVRLGILTEHEAAHRVPFHEQ